MNSPYDFGVIAAANSLSDIYAKAGEPKVALSLVMFPFDKLDNSILKEMLEGCNDKLEEATTILAGGHTIDDDTIKLGLAVFGISGNTVWKINSIQEKDNIYITKPLGTGIISQGIKLNKIDEYEGWEAIESMKRLNKYAKNILINFPITACTDVTGYGLIGHLYNMVNNTPFSAELFFNEIPFFNNTELLAKQHIVPGGTRKNLSYFNDKVEWASAIEEYQKLLCCDAQTSGGLLFTIPAQFHEQIIKEFTKNKIYIKHIGTITKKLEKAIKVS